MMKAFALSLVILFAAQAFADASVWEQEQSVNSVFDNMETGKVDTFDATITDVKLDELRVSFTNPEGQEKTLKLCTQDRAVNGNFYTEADRAMAIKLRVQPLKDAKKSKQKIKLVVRGPWSPCVYPLDV